MKIAIKETPWPGNLGIGMLRKKFPINFLISNSGCLFYAGGVGDEMPPPLGGLGG
ncbi:hypothetical protein [Crocosphaera sp. Alani8]|uniref:hypothetical protein n=1 Tax=Crocosphaera sp. Alani8 TaxID=3038952 RepID=UPI00313BEE54